MPRLVGLAALVGLEVVNGLGRVVDDALRRKYGGGAGRVFDEEGEALMKSATTSLSRVTRSPPYSAELEAFLRISYLSVILVRNHTHSVCPSWDVNGPLGWGRAVRAASA